MCCCGMQRNRTLDAAPETARPIFSVVEQRRAKSSAIAARGKKRATIVWSVARLVSVNSVKALY